MTPPLHSRTTYHAQPIASMLTPSVNMAFGDAPMGDTIFNFELIRKELFMAGQTAPASRRRTRRVPRSLPGTNLQSFVLFAPRPAPAPIKTATDVVFATFELLEKILIEMDIYSLACDQRVSTFWKEVVARSPQLQRALFLQPGTGPVNYLKLTEVDFPDDDEDFFEELSHPEVDAHPKLPQWTYSPTLSAHQGFTIYELHPLLMEADCLLNHSELLPSEFAENCLLDFCIDVESMMSWAPGPWQIMAISNPGIKLEQLSYSYTIHSLGTSRRRSGLWVNKTIWHQCATLGHLRDIVRRTMEFEVIVEGHGHKALEYLRFSVNEDQGAVSEEMSLVRVASQHDPAWLIPQAPQSITEIMVRPKSKTFKTHSKEQNQSAHISNKLSDMQKSKFDVICSAHPLLQHLRTSEPKNVNDQGYISIWIDGWALLSLSGGSWARASLLQPPCPRSILKFPAFPDLTFTDKQTVTFGFLVKQLKALAGAGAPAYKEPVVELQFKGFVEAGAPEVVKAGLKQKG
ncbi:uncharacterized protein RCC_01654 [Ramularia collo-cygni]|uniref:F-box domain-containing protein n=1 Tax=Ramularia collo-cygni TaxID=112498 RepID=A0A2D3USW7_9PEZI|nr:uncharacterized protein RCC_01654 [Ramularia collo-cygni]CZT15820.1 uncharacterized protein RCC_01654 [Ramularia collo-cygni]